MSRITTEFLQIGKRHIIVVRKPAKPIRLPVNQPKESAHE